MTQRVMGSVLLIGALLAVSVGAVTVAAKRARPLTTVSLLTDYLFNGYNVPYALGIAKGYYRDEGLNVTIAEGAGSSTTVAATASGAYDFGVVDAGTTATAITNEALPVRMIADYLQSLPMGFIYAKGTPFRTPADLVNEAVVTTPGSSDLLILPAVLAKYNLTLSDLHLAEVSQAARLPTFVATPHADLLGFSNGEYLTLRTTQPTLDVQFKSYAQFGVNAYSTGLVTSAHMIREKPGVVKAFVAATTRAWEYSLKHPSEAATDAVRLFPALNKANLISSFKISAKLLHTARTKGHTIGWMAPQDWSQTLNLYQKYAGMKKPLPLSQYYTDKFLP